MSSENIDILEQNIVILHRPAEYDFWKRPEFELKIVPSLVAFLSIGLQRLPVPPLYSTYDNRLVLQNYGWGKGVISGDFQSLLGEFSTDIVQISPAVGRFFESGPGRNAHRRDFTGGRPLGILGVFNFFSLHLLINFQLTFRFVRRGRARIGQGQLIVVL